MRRRWGVAARRHGQMTRALSPATLRLSRAGLRAALAGFAAGMCWIAATAHAAAPRGFIVELKDAPQHFDAARETALHAGRDDVLAVQRERLQRVVKLTGADGAKVRPQGRAAHVLDFGRSLSPSETEGMLAKLRASPEVAWAEPNDREPLQQSTTPSDPFFPGTVGQWWLQPAGGTDALSIDDATARRARIAAGVDVEQRQSRRCRWPCSTPASPRIPNCRAAGCRASTW